MNEQPLEAEHLIRHCGATFPEGEAWSIGAERQCGTPDKRSVVRCEGPRGEGFWRELSPQRLKEVKKQHLTVLAAAWHKQLSGTLNSP